MSNDITFDGLEEVEKDLGKTIERINDLPETTFVEWSKEVIQSLKDKTPRPRGTYQRTGNLQNSWNVIKLTDGVSVSNNATNRRGTNYSRFVVGDGDGLGQSNTNRGNWYLMREEVDTLIKDLLVSSEKDIINE